MADLIVYLPEIAKDDYAAFVRLRPQGGDFPEQYSEWLALTQGQAAHHSERQDSIVYVKTASGEFAAYCQARGCPHDKSNLYSFIMQKARAPSKW